MSSLEIRWLKNNLTLIYSTGANQTMNNESKIIEIFLAGAPRRVNRFMLVDILKASKPSALLSTDSLRVRLCGNRKSFVQKLIISNRTVYDEQAFYSATRWLLNNQDQLTGCWPIGFTRYFGTKRKYHLPVPWCSAMSQGNSFRSILDKSSLYLPIEDKVFLC